MTKPTTTMIGVSHEKGGAGATTTAVMIGYASKGAIVDLDPQGSATAGLMLPDGEKGSAYLGIEECNMQKQAFKAKHGGFLVAADARLSRLASEPELEKIEDALISFGRHNEITIVDTQGGRNSLTLGVAKSCDCVIVPTQLSDIDIHAAIRWINTLKRVGLTADKICVLPTRVDNRLRDNLMGINILKETGARVLTAGNEDKYVGVPQKAIYTRLITSGEIAEEILNLSESILEEVLHG